MPVRNRQTGNAHALKRPLKQEKQAPATHLTAKRKVKSHVLKAHRQPFARRFAANKAPKCGLLAAEKHHSAHKNCAVRCTFQRKKA